MLRAGLLTLAAELAPAATAGSDAGTRALLLDAARVGQTLFAVGERGHMGRSADSGQSWQVVPTPTHATLTGISFADTHHGWAVGHDGTILRTDDSGGTWIIQSSKLPPELSFLDVLAIDSRHVIAGGAFGAFFETLDAGRTWTQRSVLADELHINRFQAGPESVVYLIGEQGTLWKSADIRKGAERLDTGYEGSLNGMVVLKDSLLVYGLRGHVFRSEDQGSTWVQVEGIPPVLVATGIRHSSGAVLLAGQARVFLISRDAGHTFMSLETGLTWPVADLLEAPDGAVIAFGEGGARRIQLPETPAQTLPSP